jgi:hypothetical protein
MSIWRDKLVTLSVSVSIGIVLLVSFVLLHFAWPVEDDFCNAALDRNWLDYVGEMYRTWTGRWAAQAFYVLVMPRVNITSAFYPLTLTLVYVACALAYYGTLRALFGETLSKIHSGLLAGALVAFYWAGMPEPGQTIYWLPGAIEYTLPFALNVFVLLLVIGASSWGRVVAACVLAVLVTGLQEIAAIALTFVLAVATASAFRLRSESRNRYSAVLVCVVIGTAINALAPGNAVRLEQDFGGGDAHNVVGSIKFTIRQAMAYLIPWLIDGKLLAASVLLAASPWFRRATPRWVCANLDYWRVLIPAVWLLTVCGIFLAMGWAVGLPGPARLYNFAYGVFLLGWIATLFVWTRALAIDGDNEIGARARLVASLVLALGLLTSTNVARGIRDLYGEQNVVRFRSEMQQRFAAVAAAKAKGSNEAVLTLAPRIPESYFQRDIGPDPKHRRNQCVANYFGLRRIWIAAPARGP